MNSKIPWTGIFALATAFSFAPFAFGQEGAGSAASPPSSVSGSSDQHYSGASSIRDSAANAGSAVENGARTAYHGVKSSAITAEAKAALLKDAQTRHTTIHVSTTDGIVTLSGRVPTRTTAEHAAEVVARQDGVKGVRNRLKLSNHSSDENAPSAMHEQAPAPSAPAPTEPNAPAERMAQPPYAQ
jgi:BON domain